jgi:methionyl-tRNA formyltransferase
VLPKLIAGTATHHAQDLTQGRYYGGRKPEDGRIDFTQSAKRIHDFVRALTTPYPGAFSDIAGKRIIVLATERRSPVGGYLEAIPPEEAQSSMLFEHQGELFLRCTDGGVLALTQLLCDGVPLRPGEFATKVSELPVKL